jgi:hypothetical protein
MGLLPPKNFRHIRLKITVIWHDVTLEVEFCFYPWCKGHCDKYGAPEEPDTEAEIEIQQVVGGGWDITGLLSDEDFGEIEELIWMMDREYEPDEPEEVEMWQDDRADYIN